MFASVHIRAARAFSKSAGLTRHAKRTQPKAGFRPGLETLEDRCLLSTSVLTEFPLPRDSFVFDITSGPGGNLWFTDNTVGKISMTGTITEYSPTKPMFNSAEMIVSGPDGNLWFSDPADDEIGIMTPDGVFTAFPIIDPVGNAVPVRYMTAGADGNVWFQGGYGYIGKITPSGQVTLFQPKAVGGA